MKTLVIILGVVIVVLILVLILVPPKEELPAGTSFEPTVLGADIKNAMYAIEGERVLLVDGQADARAGKVRYFGNEALGDLNGDGTTDIAFLATLDGGGSGTFFYIITAFKKDGGYKGNNAIFIGDRIAPQTTEIRAGEVIVNYAERRQGEPMTAQPSVGISRYFKMVGEVLKEVSK